MQGTATFRTHSDIHIPRGTVIKSNCCIGGKHGCELATNSDGAFAVETGDGDALLEGHRRPANVTNRTDEGAEDTAVAYTQEQPPHGQVRTSNALKKQRFFVSPSGVRGVWLRHV